MNDEIDENLRRVFTQALDEEIPDRFKNLLDQLRSKDTDGPAGKDGE